MRIEEVYIAKYDNNEAYADGFKPKENYDNVIKELNYYMYCDKKDGDICDHIHCICRTMRISEGTMLFTCSRKKYAH